MLGVFFRALFSSPAKQGAAASLNSDVCALAVDESLGVYTREKVSQIKTFTVQILDFPLVVSFQQAKNLLLLQMFLFLPLCVSIMAQKLPAETAPNKQRLH